MTLQKSSKLPNLLDWFLFVITQPLHFLSMLDAKRESSNFLFGRHGCDLTKDWSWVYYSISAIFQIQTGIIWSLHYNKNVVLHSCPLYILVISHIHFTIYFFLCTFTTVPGPWIRWFQSNAGWPWTWPGSLRWRKCLETVCGNHPDTWRMTTTQFVKAQNMQSQGIRNIP